MKKSLDSNMIKIIAIIAMSIDHISWMIPSKPYETEHDVDLIHECVVKIMNQREITLPEEQCSLQGGFPVCRSSLGGKSRRLGAGMGQRRCCCLPGLYRRQRSVLQ